MSQAAIEKLVRDLDPLFESLVGGTPEDRAAIWGQAEQESNDNPAAIEFPKTPGKGGEGLWQHTDSRRRLLEAFAVTLRKPWSDPETQVRFVAQELLGTYAHAWHQIRNVASTLRTKTETAMALFEAPQDWHKEIVNPGTTTANLPRRLKGAGWALAAIQQAKGKPVTDLSGIAPAPAAPAVPETSTAHKLAQFIEEHQIPAETVIRAFAVGNLGIGAPVVDGLFTFLNRFDLTDLVDLLERHPNGLQFLMELVQMFLKGRTVA